jgi:hypothetical protein
VTEREALRELILELMKGVPGYELRGKLVRAITALEIAALRDGNNEVLEAIERRAKAKL